MKATAFAVRGSPSRRAISPKKSPSLKRPKTASLPTVERAENSHDAASDNEERRARIALAEYRRTASKSPGLDVGAEALTRLDRQRGKERMSTEEPQLVGSAESRTRMLDRRHIHDRRAGFFFIAAHCRGNRPNCNCRHLARTPIVGTCFAGRPSSSLAGRHQRDPRRDDKPAAEYGPALVSRRADHAAERRCLVESGCSIRRARQPTMGIVKCVIAEGGSHDRPTCRCRLMIGDGLARLGCARLNSVPLPQRSVLLLLNQEASKTLGRILLYRVKIAR